MCPRSSGVERVVARCFGRDLKRKLLTRVLFTAFYETGQEQCILQVSGLLELLAN